MEAYRGTVREKLALRILQLTPFLVVLAALPYKRFDLDRYFVPKELILHAAAALAGFLLLSARRRLAATRIDLLLAGFLLASIVSALLATNGWLAWRAVRMSISSAVLFWCASAIASLGWGTRLVVPVIVAAVAGAATALAQAYAGPVSELFTTNRAPGGTFGNRNFMAHLAAIAAPALIIWTLRAERHWGYLAGLIAMVLSAAAIVLSRSRAAWLSLAVGAAVVALAALATRTPVRERGIAGRLALLLVIAAAAATAAVYLPNRLEWRSATPYIESVRDVVNFREGSGRGRVRQYDNSLAMFKASPLLGVGPGNWPVEYPRNAASHDPSLASDIGMTDNPWPSSDWVAFLTERGAVATALILAVLLGLVIRALASLPGARRSGDHAGAAASLILIGTVVVTGVVGAFDAALLLAVPAAVLWILAGGLAPLAERRMALPAGARWAALAAILTFCVGGAVRSGLQWRAMATVERSQRRASLEQAVALDGGNYRIRLMAARSALSAGDCRATKLHAGRAAALFPTAREPRTILSGCR